MTPFTWPLSNRAEPHFTPSRCGMSIFKLGRTRFAQPQLRRWFRPGYNGVRGVRKNGRTWQDLVGRRDSEAHRSVERENYSEPSDVRKEGLAPRLHPQHPPLSCSVGQVLSTNEQRKDHYVLLIAKKSFRASS